MSSGWVKLHRKITEWEWYSDVNTTRVFLHLLVVANHKDKKWRGIDIKRGQRLTSISALSKETSLTIKNIRTAIKRLKSTNEVASYSTAQHTVFTMVNYDLYQEEASETANQGQTKGKQGATNKNVKNEKNVKNKDLVESEPQRKKFNFTDVDYQCAEWIYSLVKQVAPSSKKPNFESWANTVRLMRESDKLTHNDISEVFTWANQDSFWSVNILSAAKLRQKFPQLQAKMKGVSNGSIKEHGQKLSAHERAKQRNDAKYRQTDECGLVVGTNDGHMGRAVDKGEGRATIEHVDTRTFIDYE